MFRNVRYYGNAVVSASVATTAGELNTSPYAHTVQLIRKAMKKSLQNYETSTMNLLSSGCSGKKYILGPTYTFIMSDLRLAGFHNVDYGWGKPVYGG